MIAETDLKDKHVLVVGAGTSGMAAISALRKAGAKISLQDRRKKEELAPAVLEYIDGKLTDEFFGEDPEETAGCDAIVLSPGVSPYLPFLLEARKAGVKVIGEMELAYVLGRGTFVAITGTNGKTTTTALVGEIFRQAGRKTEVVGNIGVPAVSKAIAADDDTWLITEVSSFQMETIETFKPHIGCILNLTPDHLDRHKTMENYGKAKARVFENQDEKDFAVVNYDDGHCFGLATGTDSKIFPFSRSAELKEGAFVKDGNIVIKEDGKKEKVVCKAKDLRIPGSHNLENALAAAAVAYCAGIGVRAIARGLKAFPGVEHRIEFCETVNGIKYVNDSKGTNTDAAIKAIQAIDGNIILIAGGYDKGAEYEDLVDSFGDKVKWAVLIGKTAAKIKGTASSMGFADTVIVESMEAAVREATAHAKRGDTVLLSPACASWDMYRNFEERGRDFKECVKKIGEE